MNLEYVPVPVMYRVNQAQYVIHILVAASQEYVNTYSTRRVRGQRVDGVAVLGRLGWRRVGVAQGLAFTRYCNDQYCMVYGIRKGVGGRAYIAQGSCNSIAIG